MYLKEAIELRTNDICKEKGITINKLATICGITQSTLANWKARPKSNISTITILRICRGLNMSDSGYRGFIRGIKGSTNKHLDNLNYKIKKENERLEKLYNTQKPKPSPNLEKSKKRRSRDAR